MMYSTTFTYSIYLSYSVQLTVSYTLLIQVYLIQNTNCCSHNLDKAKDLIQNLTSVFVKMRGKYDESYLLELKCINYLNFTNQEHSYCNKLDGTKDLLEKLEL